ncbi:arabinosyltransferase C-terminal domain-containing protein [Actinomycetospora sp. CA-084318]|uniref:arabinosyltransferase C-terminal domain-containing protein n=1 Tax=Actinomycetospora sp. CA-084318 TaxID=3239892 RepID=UPI003D996544
MRLVVVLAALLSGVVAVVLAAMVPAAAVESSTSTVSWPPAGAAPEPTTLLLVPYRPATLDAAVPCRAITAARGRSGATTILATVLGGPAEGLSVRTTPTEGGPGEPTVDVLASGRRIPVDVPDEDCALTIRADAAGMRVTVGDPAGSPTVTVPGLAVPEVFAATTDLAGDDASGLSLEARTPAWFDNAPTAQKSGGTDGKPDTRDGRFTWGSRAAGDGSVGSLTTGWFGLPALRPGQELATSVAGRTSDGTSLTWQFGDGDRVVGSRPVVETPEPDRGYRGYAADPDQARLQDRANPQVGWRTLTLEPSAVPDGADRVRLVAVDDRTDENGWIALTGPRVVDVVPLGRWLAGRGPVLVDWAIAFAWPCTGPLPRVDGGVAQTPGAFITAPTGPADLIPGERTAAVGPIGDLLPQRWTQGADGLTLGQDSGGSFAGLSADGDLRELDTRLSSEPGRRWGRVLVPELDDLAADRYAVARTTATVPGTAGDPPPDVGGLVSAP